MAAAPANEQRLKLVNHGDRNPRRGGYDCEFVILPPEAFQAECPICLQILKEPCVISCPCEQKICRECVEQIKKNKKPCPLCNKTEITSFMQDYGLERYLKVQDVYCSKKRLGCQWKGKLGDFEQHLNENPSPEEQLTGCGFVEVECKHGCGEWYERRFIDIHQNEKCPQRPYSCEYCKDYSSTFKDVKTTHYLICKKYPLPCPNKCQDGPFVEKSKMKLHLNDECPLTEVSCPFAYTGCEVKLPRRDMPGHPADISMHFPLLVSLTRENQQKQRAMESQFEERFKVIERQYQLQEEKLKTAVEQNKIFEEKVNAREKEIAMLKEEIQPMKMALGEFPLDFKVAFKKKSVHLPPFFTHPHGYRMCIGVDPNGFGDGEGTHVSLYAYFMQGLFDEHLKWPFRGKITIHIVNQAGDHDHIKGKLNFNDETGDQYCSRVTRREKADCGWGYQKFLAHTELHYNAAKKTQYLKDNIIIVRVVRVKLSQ